MATFTGEIYEIHGGRHIGFLRDERGACFFFHKHLVAGHLWISLREGHKVKCIEVDRGPDGGRRARILEVVE